MPATIRAGLRTVLASLLALPVAAQINYVEDFDAGIGGWTIQGGFENEWYSDSTTCGGVGGAVRSNLYGGATSCEFVSPLLGVATGGPLIFNFDYKVHAWSANVTPVFPWGQFEIQISSDAVAWTTVDTVVDTMQLATCQSATSIFTPPAGDLYIRLLGTWTTGDYWLNFDNLDIQLDLPCSGVPAPGDTVVVGEVCDGETVELTLQNPTPGSDVSYQWYESYISNTGPWLALGTQATQTASVGGTKYFYCDVTCAIGPDTTASNVATVTPSPFVNPQPFDTSATDDCWSIDDSGGLDIEWDSGQVRFAFAFSGAVGLLTSPLFDKVGDDTYVYLDVAGQNFVGVGGPVIDVVTIEESADGGLSWSTVVDMDNGVGGWANTAGSSATAFTPSPSDWAARAFLLTSGTNRIRFRGSSSFGNHVYIDNVAIGIPPAANHSSYGSGCGAPVVLSSSTAPIENTNVTFDATGAPELSPGAGVSVGVLVIDFTQDFSGTDLSPLLDADCLVHINNLTVLLAMIGPTGTASAVSPLPAGVAPGTLLFEQAAFLTDPTPTNLLGIHLSNGLRSSINTF